MKINFITNLLEYRYDYEQILRNFYFELEFVEEKDSLIINLDVILKDDLIINKVEIKNFKKNKVYSFARNKKVDNLDNLADKTKKRLVKRYSKICLYLALSRFLRKKLDWGALTGIRPTKLAWEFYNEIKCENTKLNDLDVYKLIFKILVEDFYLKKNKANLVIDILKTQKSLNKNENHIDFYINIPFCTTRCSYCSFISAQIDKNRTLISPYINALLKDIENAKLIIKKNNYIVDNIYIGGGTPTSFTADELELILSKIDFKVTEFTVEAGRPDTIDIDKLNVLNNHGVTRISINPQTFNENVLKEIGRCHSKQDIFNAFILARKFKFVINMDTIAGLPKDSFKSFKYTINQIIKLNPENITVHTLALKKKSTLAKDKTLKRNDKIVNQMVNYARRKLQAYGFKPYYMYRQKYMLGNLENVGFTKNNYKCEFNIDSMEESKTILACGANAISKRVFTKENRIERHANAKDIHTYINNLDKFLIDRNKLFND